MSYIIVPISAKFLERARAGRDDQLFPVEFFEAEGGEPLRDVLRRAVPGEPIALASFSPHELNGPFKEYGPVYFCASPSDEVVALDSLPAEPSSNYFLKSYVLRAYSREERIVGSAVTTPEEGEQVISDFFRMPEVAFIHARFTAYGCYGCRIERAQQ